MKETERRILVVLERRALQSVSGLQVAEGLIVSLASFAHAGQGKPKLDALRRR
ncbi:MAG TPA: hypothetical protein VMF89_37790 [Polyangiales bacterium]|nr:hypothetical protein [Polyangiales bacterium]